MILKNLKKSLTDSIVSRLFSSTLNVITGHDNKRRLLSVCRNVFKYPSPDTNVPTSPAGGEVLNSAFNASALNVILRRERSELSGESRNIMAILLKEGNSIVYRLFSVITGFIPVIVVQRVTNQFNKFAILLHKYRFSKDCRNRLCVTSGNDWCWGRWSSICCKFFNASALNVMLACEHSELPRASRNIMAILLNAANSILSRLFSVITGFIPVILVQQVTNLVNKFAILLHKYRFNQDCRDKPGNDWCWGRWLSVCCSVLNASARSVILRRERSELSGESRNIMAISLNAADSTASCFLNVITGRVPVILVQQVTNQVNKFAVLLHKYRFIQDCRNRLCVMSGNDSKRRWLNTCCHLFKQMYHPGSSANELTLKAKDDCKSVLQYGRSMIEMLGVLAIIAVLSVGGIAGYSKAMEKFKLNKMVQQYNEMLFGVVQNLDEFHAPFEWKSTEIIKALNITPPSWTVYKTSNTNSMKDDLGNTITWFPESRRTLRIMFDLNGKTQIQKKMCTEIARNVFMPLRSVLGMIYIEGGLYYYGDTYCSPNLKPYERCLKDLSFRGINSICASCVKRNHCFLWLYFYH